MINQDLAAVRVAIAKDVIYRLSNPTQGYSALSNYYINIDGTDITGYDYLSDQDLNDDLQSHVGKLDGRCQVCALGGLLLSKARLYNHVPLDLFHLGFEANAVRQGLLDIFELMQLRLIEIAFEVDDFFGLGLDESSIEKALHFGSQFNNEASRMIAIMQNIVNNNGTFIP